LADVLSKLKREYDELEAYTSTQDARIGVLESKEKVREAELLSQLQLWSLG